MDWESWLRMASLPPSDNEDAKRDRTEAQIRAALAAHRPLRGRPYRVYVKGSYANNTNVRLNYDVDIAVEYCGFFYADLSPELVGHDWGEFNMAPNDDPYTMDEFRRDVLYALHQAFGKTAVTVGNIAYRVRERRTTLPADVVPCWEYRRYVGKDRMGAPVYHAGSRVYLPTGDYKNNFPEIQLANGRAKNNRTHYRYKHMVRALKKLQAKLVNEGLLDAELPSYFTECLVYNVPDNYFGNARYVDDMRSVLAVIFNATFEGGNYSEWTQVHELMPLFDADFKRMDAHRMTDIAWDAMGFR